ncbi:unnamed protein product [Cuscuta campestris]|uniref:AB hydrolase-1 domain-containing protein n=1 Tax=Cuscuta campestris TaxID=132261 RepID=A0A484LB31_9ASTE|nr:unnamed protein product [Cuscuta campestris]
MILADKGYDVWISNTRGTEYSRRHQYLDPNAREFWYWTWDHLAKYDLPVLIDLVFKTTGQKVHFVGHALGSLLCLAALAEGNVGVDKVRSAALLSPTVYASHMTSILVKAAVKLHIAEHLMVQTVCFSLLMVQMSEWLRDLPLNGKNCCINSAAIRHFAESGMQSTSIRNLKHLSQNVRHGTLEKYDYGNAEVNMQHYGRRKPPLYDLSRIPKNLPVFISYGGADQMADTADVKVLLGELKPALNTDMLRVQYVPNYAHYDFIMGLNANHLVYTQLIAFLDPLK